ncbi:hypothetical protein SAMN05877809_10761 [Rhodobacter sp. JA431]|uniref:hypothetical protein n=1 Tax=Rhodobacter sp. JA431 TaxID=570013 RepID=UPI000BDD9F1E|nr:hypothetical protein [Rhodobacter sp. JA431]SOC14055.1 hypothetical protein SAMN05877809_10761 [Rhodobacter sp. JA431]
MRASEIANEAGLSRVESLADLGGGAQAEVIAAQALWDCDITLIDMAENGDWPAQPSAWVDEYLAALEAAEIPADRVRVVHRARDLRPVDLLLNLKGWGDCHKVKHLAPVLERALHAESRMLIDIRKGSGSFPFLKESGETEILAELGERAGKAVMRVRYTPEPPPPTSDSMWAEIAQDLAGSDGFFTANGAHSFLYIPRGRTLVVTFDNLDIAMVRRETRRPWGFEFIEKQGWSMLGVMAGGWTWYRDPWVSEEFDRLAAEGFFAQFDHVVFYGASMGGYAAAAFSAACPGADVVAISPQSTVDRSVVPFETRYKVVWDADFSGKYGDAAIVSQAARRVVIFYDPYEPLDAAHAARFEAPNVMKLRAPLMGHRLGSTLNQMGILSPVILGALDGTLTKVDFYRRLRARHDFPRYQRELFQRALKRGHEDLARRLGEWVLARGDNRPIRLAMMQLRS